MYHADLSEDSPNTLEGSFTKDLMFSKFWLCDLICKAMIQTKTHRFNSIYILGSWFGNMCLILKQYNIDFDEIILVDKDPKCMEFSRKMLSGVDKRLDFLNIDVNEISYKTCKDGVLVINTSCNDMTHDARRWFHEIPKNSMVALQSRDDIESISEMNRRYPLKYTLFLGCKSFSDPEKNYQRLSKIGIK